MKLWLIVIFVLVPVSMIVSEVRAEENPYKQPPNISIQLSIPHEISVKYLWKDNPAECLIPLEVIPINNCGAKVGVVPFVTVAERQKIVDTGKKPDDLIFQVEAIVCLCKSHKGNRIQVMNALDDRGVMQPIWFNPEMLNRKKREEPPSLLPKDMA